MKVHLVLATSLSWSRSSLSLVVSCSDGVVRVVDVASGRWRGPMPTVAVDGMADSSQLLHGHAAVRVEMHPRLENVCLACLEDFEHPCVFSTAPEEMEGYVLFQVNIQGEMEAARARCVCEREREGERVTDG